MGEGEGEGRSFYERGFAPFNPEMIVWAGIESRWQVVERELDSRLRENDRKEAGN